MALSLLLRGTLKGCRGLTSSVRPVERVSSLLHSPLASLACNKFSHSWVKAGIENQKPITLPKEVKQFSTSIPRLDAHKAHDHAKIWTLERALSAGLIGIMPLGIMFPNVLFDVAMAVTVVMHTHWGIEAIVLDYVRPSIFGNVIPKISLAFVYALSIGLLVGLFNLIFNNAGLGNSIRILWRL